MIERRTWEEFKNAGLLWWVNRILHIFGWAIVFEMDSGKVTEVYPAHCRFRGFSEEAETDGHRKLAVHIVNEIERIGGGND